MKIFSFLVFLIFSATLSTALADCDQFTLVQAQEVSKIIAQNTHKLLDNNGKPVKVGAVCLNKVGNTKDTWTVSVNCSNSKSCKPVHAGKFSLKAEFSGQSNFSLAEVANLPKSVCNFSAAEKSEGSAPSEESIER